jgi:hypothetical protein
LAPTDWSAAALWLAVVGSGAYHGLNPAMGWPLAVSAALMGRGRRDLVAALGALVSGHVVAMAAVLLPFAALAGLVAWQREIRVAAGLVVAAGGVVLLLRRRHPRVLARIPPHRLALWSFAAATAHGAGLMLVPIYLGLCRFDTLDQGEQAASALMAGSLATALAVSALHAAAMVVAGGALAFAAYRWLGPRMVARTWFNLDVAWAMTLVVVGGLGAASAA